MKWQGCTELSVDLRQDWTQVQVCLKELKPFGRVGSFQISQPLTGDNRWRQWSDLRTKRLATICNDHRGLLHNLDQFQAKEALHKKTDQPYSDSPDSKGEEVAHCLHLVTWQQIARTGQDQQGR